MRSLFETGQVLQAFLEGRRWKFCFIGGIALQRWGIPRLTRDLDLSLFTGRGGEGRAIDELLAS
ncbi:MAG: nucleotidyl transferase AbiEii/AbiGii toxin family protein [Candidatus Riflebacteria bacterium]|nr:nucleotidyl transferase AbiEii/AbiGii toxin family protein [Candidatus Riflebacteria bacterium]